MSETLAVEVEGLACGYGGQAFVRDVDLVAAPGEVCGLFGVNGAGKTTLLMGLGALLPPLAGEVRYFGEPVEPTRRAHRMVRRGVTLVPDDRGLFPSLTVDQHLRLVVGSRPAAMAAVYRRLPQLVGVRDRRAGLLSGGEQQMLSIGRALLTEPKVLLIDEMSAGLAPMIVEELMAMIRALADERSMAIVLVEQHVSLALEVVDSVHVLSHGRIVLQAPVDDVRRAPDLLEEAYFGGAA